MKLSILVALLFLFDLNKISTAQFNFFDLFFGHGNNRIFALIDESVGNRECARDLKTFFTGVAQKKPWALQMFDASGKYPGGLLAGHVDIVGNFDQCLNVSNEEEEHHILGQYCKIYINASEKYSTDFINTMISPVEFARSIGVKINNNTLKNLEWLKLSYGICLPHSCSSEILQNISLHAEHTLKLPIQMKVHDFNCRNRNKEVFPLYADKYIISFFCMYAVLLLMSTCYDILINKGNGDNILMAFSVLKNGKQLFAKPKNNDDGLDALNGIKVLHMLWVITGHRYLLNIISGITNFTYLNEWRYKTSTSILLSASYAVDTFLLLSGLLISFLFLKHVGGNGNIRFSVPKMYFYRCLRISPSLLAMILFYITIFKNLGDGPDWVQVAGRFSMICSRTWWATALFINNYIEPSHVCMEHSWYLAVDTQLFFLSPILLINLKKWPWKTCIACIVVCICSGIYTYAITIQHNYATIFFEANNEFIRSIYYPTPVRMPPWFIGIIFGFLIYRYGNIKLTMVNKCMAWTITMFFLCLPIYLQFHLNRGHEYHAVEAALFNSSTRQIWSFGIGIFSYLCSTGNGGIVGEFLSLPVFQIISRFCYSVYLTHFPVMAYFIGEKRYPEYFASLKVVHQIMGDLPFIFLAATIWTLAFESPFRVIGKLLSKTEYIHGKSDDQVNEDARKTQQKKSFDPGVMNDEKID